MEPVGEIWRVVGISSVAFNWHIAQGREEVGAAGTMAGLADVTNWRLKLQQQRSLSPRYSPPLQDLSFSYIDRHQTLAGF
jgi:hypothetical protein